MKKYLILLLLLCNTSVFAQFKISGKITNYTGHEELKINIPLVYAYSDANSVKIPVAKDGAFSVTLPIKQQKFANLTFQQTFHLLLLSPGKNLSIELNEANRGFKVVKGTAQAENNLLQTLNIAEYPFFLQNSDGYVNLSLADMQAKIIKPYFAARDKKVALVNQSAISAQNKKLIAAEVKYAAYNNLCELISVGDQYKKTIDAFIIDIFNKANPKPETLPAGPQYYKFANNYIWYIHIKTNFKRADHPLSSDEKIDIATKYLPNTVTEQIAYQHIMLAYYNKDKQLAEEVAKIFYAKFPKSSYLADIKTKVGSL